MNRFSDSLKESSVIGYLAAQGFNGISNPPAADIFADARYRVIFSTAKNLHRSGREVHVLSINEEIVRLNWQEILIKEFGRPDWESWPALVDSSYSFNTKATIDLLRDLEALKLKRAAHAIGVQITEGEITPSEAIEQLSALSAGSSSDFPEIVDSRTLCDDPPELPEDLIAGLLHRGSKGVLGGPSKSNKTWTLSDMAVSVATGTPFWGFPCAKGRVLYVNFEISSPFFTRRLSEICVAKRVIPDPGCLDVLNLRGFAADAAVILPKIQRQAATKGYALIVLDPLYKLLGGRDENSSRDMADLMNAVERLAVDTGAAVVFGSHFAKGNAAGKESMDRISGSGVFARDPDTILTMTKHEQEDAFTVEMTLRNHPPQDSFVVRRQHPLMVVDGQLDPEKLKQTGGRKEEVSADDVLSVLGNDSLTYAEWLERAKETLFTSQDTFKRRLRKLKADGRIRQSPTEGGKYVKA